MAIANKNDLTHVVRTTQQWESSYDKYECIPEGVLCIEFTTSGQALAKIGNGRDIFSKLPYIGGADLTNYFTKEQTTECINDILKAKRYICIKGILNNKNQLPTNATCGDLYFVISQNQSSSNKYDEYVYSPNNTWENLGSIPIDIDLSEYAKIVYVDEKIDEVNERIDDIEQHGTHTHANKDILDLITAAFTAEEKDKLSTLYNYDDTELRELITQASHTHSNKDILDAITSPFTKEDRVKLDNLTPYDDSILKEKITALERLAHEHSNKKILDRTTASFTTEYERKMRWIRLYTGCTGMEEGIAGLVPAAQAGEEDYVLSGSGEWVPQTGGGGTYELPIASTTVLGGIKVGDGLEINENGKLSVVGGGGGDTITQGGGINVTTDPQTHEKIVSVNAGTGLAIDQQTGELYVTGGGGDSIAEGGGISINTDPQTGVKTISVNTGDHLSVDSQTGELNVTDVDYEAGQGIHIGADYTLIEYIKNSGNYDQIILTDIIPNFSDKIEIDMKIGAAVANTVWDKPIFGCSGSTPSSYRYSTNLYLASNDSNISCYNHFTYESGNTGSNFFIRPSGVSYDGTNAQRQTLTMSGSTATLGNVSKNFSNEINNSFIDPQIGIAIFGNISDVGTKNYFNQCNLTIYGVKLYDSNDTLLHDLRPAERGIDGEAGLYDLITHKFYGNAGNGSFVKGPPVSSVDDRLISAKIGNGLQFDSNDAIEVNVGNGLQINQDGELEIDSSIIPDSYDAGNGIEITEVTHEDEFRVQNQEYFFDTRGLTCGLNARVWTTVNDGDILAAMCIHNNGGNQVPLFVGLTEDSVKVSQNYDSNILGPNGSFDYRGKTWYFTADYALSGTDGQDTQNHIQTLPTTYSFSSTPSNFVPAAKDLIDLAVLLPDVSTPTINAKIGNGLSFDANGAIQADAQPLSPATDSTLGGVIIGDGILVDNDGTISVDPTIIPEVIEYEAGTAISIEDVEHGGVTFDAWDSGTGWENVCYSDSTGNSVINYQYEAHSPISNSYTLPAGATHIHAIAYDQNDTMLWTSFSWIDSNNYHFASTSPDDGHYSDWFEIPAGAVKVNFGVRHSKLNTTTAMSLNDIKSVDITVQTVSEIEVDAWNGGTGWLNGDYGSGTSNDFYTNWYYTYHYNYQQYIEVPEGATHVMVQGISNENDSHLEGGGCNAFDSNHNHVYWWGCAWEWHEISSDVKYVQPNVKWDDNNTRTISGSDVKSVTLVWKLPSLEINQSINVKYGDGLTVNQDNELEVNVGDGLFIDSTNNDVNVKIGRGLSINDNNEIDVNLASNSTFGIVKIGDGIDIDQYGIISVDKMAPFRPGIALELVDESGRLPEGYARVEYVSNEQEGAWTQINYVPNANTRVVSRMSISSRSWSGSGAPYNTEYAMYGIYYPWDDANRNEYDFSFKPSYAQGSTTPILPIRVGFIFAHHTWDSAGETAGGRNTTLQPDQIFTVETSLADGLKIDNNVIHTVTQNVPLNKSINMGIFIKTSGNSSSGGQTYVRGKIYTFKIYENDELKVNLIPCIQLTGNNVGFYDSINGIFYPSIAYSPFETDTSTIDVDPSDWVMNLLPATSTTIGGVKEGQGVTIDPDGTINVTGGSGDTVEAGDGIDIDTDSQTGNKVISVVTGDGLTVNQDNELEVNIDAGDGIDITTDSQTGNKVISTIVQENGGLTIDEDTNGLKLDQSAAGKAINISDEITFDSWNNGTGWANEEYHDNTSNTHIPWNQNLMIYPTSTDVLFRIPDGVTQAKCSVTSVNPSISLKTGLYFYNAQGVHFAGPTRSTDPDTIIDIPAGSVYVNQSIRKVNDTNVFSDNVAGATITWVTGGTKIDVKYGTGLTLNQDNELEVNIGDGLSIDPDTGAINVTGGGGGDSIAEGDGITITTDSQTGVKTIGVNVGSGLEIDPNTGTLNVTGSSGGGSGNYSAGEAIDIRQSILTNNIDAIRWDISEIKTNGGAWTQVRYVEFCDSSGTAQILSTGSGIWEDNTAVTYSHDPAGGGSQEITDMIANTRKMCAAWRGPGHTLKLTFILDTATAPSNIVKFRMKTGDDEVGRDPKAWKIYVRDSVTQRWYLVHETENAEVTNNRSTWSNYYNFSTPSDTSINVKYGTGLSVDPVTNELFVDGQLPEGTILKKLTYMGNGSTTANNIQFEKKPLAILSIYGSSGTNYIASNPAPIDAPYLLGDYGGVNTSNTCNCAMSYNDTTNVLTLSPGYGSSGDAGFLYNVNERTYTVWYLVKGHTEGGTSATNEVSVIKSFTYVGDGNATNTIQFPETPDTLITIYGVAVNNDISSNTVPITARYLMGEYGSGGNQKYGVVSCNMSFNDTTNILTLTGGVDAGARYNVSGETYTVIYSINETISSGGGSGSYEPGTAIDFSNQERKMNPDMTSDVLPYGEVIESGHYLTRYGWNAFDGVDSQTWRSHCWGDSTNALDNDPDSCYVGYVFPEDVYLDKFILSTTSDREYTAVIQTRSEGTWTTVCNVTVPNTGYDRGTYTLQSPVLCDAFRFAILSGTVQYWTTSSYGGNVCNFEAHGYSESSNQISVKYGDGLTVNNSNELEVNIGTGLAFDPQTGAINVTGGGGGSGDTVAEGAGIEITTDQQTGNKVIAVNAGTGLQVDQTTNELEIDDSVVTEDDELNLVFVPDDYQPS